MIMTIVLVYSKEEPEAHRAVLVSLIRNISFYIYTMLLVKSFVSYYRLTECILIQRLYIIN